MSEPRFGDAPFQSDLIAFAVAGATLLGVAAPHAGLSLERAQALGQAASWTLLVLLTLHGLVSGVVLAHALIATSTPALVERLGGKRLLAQAAVSLLQAAIIGVAMSRFGNAPGVFGWLGLALVAVHLGWRWRAAKREGGSRAALVQILGVASLGLGAFLAALAPRLTGVIDPQIAALAGAVAAALGWLVLSTGAYLSVVAATRGDETVSRPTVDEPATRSRLARLAARLAARLPRPRPGSSLRYLALARILALVAASASLVVAWTRRDLTTALSAVSLGLAAIAVLVGLALTARALLLAGAHHERDRHAREQAGTFTAPADEGAAPEASIDAALCERAVPRRRAHAQKTARRRLATRPTAGTA